MSLAQSLTRLPRPFDPDIAADLRAALPALDPALRDLAAGAGGSSPYLAQLITREADWLEPACDDPRAAVAAQAAALRDCPPDQLGVALRRAKGRLALITALGDLGGAWPLETVTAMLTDFADLACDLALKAEIAKLLRRGKLPGQSDADLESAAGMTILAMGKMGAGELNYSSDIDLICLFDETRFGEDAFAEARQGFVRATRALSATLNDRTAAGYVFRTDLRLRPDPAVTPVCISMEAAERYYESLGRTWERAAYIKARPCAGDLEAGARFITALRPFIWRRHLDFAAIEDAHNIRLQIRETKQTGGAGMAGRDLKLGRGGIREIEFFTQTRQLIAGGRDPDLRLRGTVEGLAALSAKGWVPDEARERLTTHYRALREAEHRIQMVNDAQTHKLPQSEEGLARVACLCDLDPGDLLDGLQARMAEVHEITESFFAPGADAADPVPETVQLDPEILSRWPNYPALRSERAAHIFNRLQPALLERLSQMARPDEALEALDGFLAGLPAGVQLFSLFEANPQLIDLLMDIVGISDTLASYLSRNAAVFDAVIGGSFFADWPGRAVLEAELAEILAAEPDYETRLDATRRWSREWMFRIGVHLLRGLVDAKTAGQHYADLAGAVVAGLFPVVVEQFATRHGPPPGRGAVVLGMGSLGAERLNAVSDLDLIVVYDPGDAEMSEGRRPLSVRPYYARLTQAMITAMTAPMAHGRLYEVDMRLRPSGTQGPVATSWRSFRAYQEDEAWVWEHLALTRARVVAGSPGLCDDMEAFRRQLLSRPRDRAAVLGEVEDMRARISAAKSPEGPWDARIGPGRMQDIELISQTGALLGGAETRDVASGLRAGVAIGWLSDADAVALEAAYGLYWSVVIAMRLISGRSLTAEALGAGGRAFLCRVTGYKEVETLQQDLETAYADCAGRITSAMMGGKTDEG